MPSTVLQEANMATANILYALHISLEDARFHGYGYSYPDQNKLERDSKLVSTIKLVREKIT